jgi:autotransporter-associated beta strand protein
VGTLTVPSGTLVFSSGSVFQINLNGTNAGVNHDQLKVASPATLSGASISIVTGTTPRVGDRFVIITNTGGSSFSTTFSGRPEGSTQIVNNVQYRISYVGGSGNDVTLTVAGYTATGVTRAWNGGGTNNFWLDPGNWLGGIAPILGDSLLFPPGAAQLTNQNDLPAGAVFNSLGFATDAVVADGNALNLFGSLQATQAAGVVTLGMPVGLLPASGVSTVQVANAGAALVLAGRLALNGSTIKSGAGLWSISGCDGAGPLDVRAGTLSLSGSNSFMGLTLVRSNAALRCQSGAALGAASAGSETVVEAGGDIFSAGAGVSPAEPLQLAGNLHLQSGAGWSGALSITGAAVAISAESAGTTSVLAGPLTFPVPTTLTLGGAGTLVVSGNSTGAARPLLDLAGGEVFVNGLLAGHALLRDGAALRGTGEVLSITNAPGAAPRLVPGANGGMLTCSNAVLTNTTFVAELAGPGTNGQLRVRGTVALGGPLEVAAGFAPAFGASFRIIDNQAPGPVIGTFLDLTNNALIVTNGMTLRVSYTGGDGNDVVLSRELAPTGVTRTWTGLGVGGHWSNPTNWLGMNVPQAGDALEFPVSAASRTVTNDLGMFDVEKVTFNGSGASAAFTVHGAQINVLSGIHALSAGGLANILFTPVRMLGPQTIGGGTSGSGLVLRETLDNNGYELVLTNGTSGQMAVIGPVIGDGPVIAIGATLGTSISFSGTNTFAGPFTVLSGQAQISNALACGAAAVPMRVGGNAILALNAPFTLAKDSISITGRMSSLSTNAISGEVRLEGSGVIVSPVGRLTILGPLTGTAPLTKSAGGTLVLAGTNTHSGGIVATAGTLLVHGTSAGGIVSSTAGATLGGTGTVATILQTAGSGILHPGEPGVPGILSASNVTLHASTAARFGMDGTNAGSGYDRLLVWDSVDLAGAALELAMTIVPPLGHDFMLVDNRSAGPVISTFNGLPEAALFLTNGMTFRITYAGGDGNDVVVTRVFAATGVTRVWTGLGLGGNWSDPVNWLGNVAPVVGDALEFPVTAFDRTATNDIPGLAVERLHITGSNAASSFTFAGLNVDVLAGIVAQTEGPSSNAFHLPLRLIGAQSIHGGLSNTMVFTGQINLNGHQLNITNINTGNSMLLQGPVVGGGALNFHGAGPAVTLNLSGTNSFTAAFTISSGRVNANNPFALGAASAPVFVSSAGEIVFPSSFPVVKDFMSVAGSLTVVATNSISGTFNVPPSGSSVFITAPGRLVLQGPVTGFGPLNKTGTGTLESTGTNGLTGTIAVAGGVLMINGSSLAGTINVGSGTTLGGTGVVGNVVMATNAPAARLLPGVNAGILTASNVTLAAAGEFVIEANGITPGTGHDQLAVRGTVALNNVALRFLLGYTPAMGDTLVLIDNDGADPVTGTFAGLPEGAGLITNGFGFRISYTGGDGNDVTLRRAFVPTGATRTWDGGGANGLWSNRTNWIGDIAPVEGDDLQFPVAGARRINSNDYPAFTAFNSVSFDGAAYTNSGNAFAVQTGCSMSAAGLCAINNQIRLLDAQVFGAYSPAASLEIRGPVNLNSNALFFDGEGSVRVSGVISGGGSLVKFGTGTTTVSATNVFTGEVDVQEGTLLAAVPGALGDLLAGTIIQAGATLELGSSADVTLTEPLTFNGFAGNPANLNNAARTNTIAGPVNVPPGNDQAQLTVSGGELRVSGTISGGGIIKSGPGRALFTGFNTHTNRTRVSRGTLLINGSQPSSPVVVDNFPTAVLGGTGVVGRLVAEGGGTVSAGLSPGTLMFTNNYETSANQTNLFEINGRLAGTNYDQVVVAGEVILNDAILRISWGYTPAFEDTFVLIRNNGPNAVSGTFAGRPEGALITNGPAILALSYVGGDGNDVTLSGATVFPTGVIRVWDGGGINDLWSNPTNWVGDLTPQQGDDIVFPPGAARTNVIFNAGSNPTFNTLSFGAAYTLSPLLLNQMRLFDPVTATNPSGVVQINVPITLDDSQTWLVSQPGATLRVRDVNLDLGNLTHAGAGTLELSGRVSGVGGLVHNGSGPLIVSGTNTFSGTVLVNSGSLVVRSPSGLGSSVAGTFVGSAAALALELPVGSMIDEPLTLGGRVVSSGAVTNAWAGTIFVYGAQACFDCAAPSRIEVDGAISGGAFFTRSNGVVALNAANSLAGPVRVDGGATVLANGNHASVNFVLTNGGTLGGTGTVGLITGSSMAGGVNPGPVNSPGILRSGNVTLGGLTLRINFTSGTPGDGHDRLDVQGLVNLANAALVVVPAIPPVIGQTFTIINNDGVDPVSGTFTGIPQGASFTSSGILYEINYAGGDGNDVTLRRVLNAPPSSILFAGTLPGGLFSIIGSGFSNAPYFIEAATNLTPPVAWQTVATNSSGTGGVYQFIDITTPGRPHRFFRVRSP